MDDKERYAAGMSVRRKVLGAEHVDRQTAAKTAFNSEFQEMMHRIRTRYSLYYPMPVDKPGRARTIRVELTGEAAKTNPKAVIRARRGYVMPAQ